MNTKTLMRAVGLLMIVTGLLGWSMLLSSCGAEPAGILPDRKSVV